VNQWLPVAAGLIGVLLGSLGSLVGVFAQHKLQRSQQIDSARRQTYTDWLHEVSKVESQMRALHVARGGQPPTADDQRRNQMQLSLADAEKRNEEIRMNSSTATEEAATVVWVMVKENPEWRGSIERSYKDWEAYYWQARRNFIDAVRTESGWETIDWTNRSRYVAQGSPPHIGKKDLVRSYVTGDAPEPA
jgi:hypothetical protein